MTFLLDKNNISMHMAASSFSCYRVKSEQEKELKSSEHRVNDNDRSPSSVRGYQPTDQNIAPPMYNASNSQTYVNTTNH